MHSSIRFIILIFIISFIISCAGRQYTTSDSSPIPFGVNAILIEIDTNEKEEVFRKAQDHLIQNGYEIDQIIEEKQLIVTSFKDLEQNNKVLRRLLFLNARIINIEDKSFLIFTGEYRGGGSMGLTQSNIDSSEPAYLLEDMWTGYRKIYHPRFSGPNERIAWEELLRVAETFDQNLGFATL